FVFPDPRNHPASVAYQGNDSRSYVQQGFTSSVREAGLMRVSDVGSKMLGDSVSDPGGSSLLPVMRRFINALNANDTQGIRSSIDSLEAASHQITEKAAVLGTRERSLRRTLHRLERYRISLKTLKSENEDVDIAKAVSELSLNQNLLAVSTKASRNIIQNTQNALFS
ncbi:MAG: flagellin, partial [Leptospirillum sp.]